jgi:hypothetical protein
MLEEDELLVRVVCLLYLCWRGGVSWRNVSERYSASSVKMIYRRRVCFTSLSNGKVEEE